MAFDLTRLSRLKSQGISLQPSIVLQIDGVDTVFGAGTIKKYIKVGDPNLFIDGTWKIGGYIELDDQLDLVSLDGTSSSVKQQLLQDKGGTSSVQTIQVSLLDKDNIATRLITPGGTLEEILGVKARVWLGWQDTAFPQDYITLFSGVIDSVESGGTVIINIAHPEAKKRQNIFIKAQTEARFGFNPVITSVPIKNTSDFLLPADSGTIRTYVRVNDEIIEYTGIDYTNKFLTGCIRGCFDTIATTHAADDTVTSFYRLTGNAIDLALKVMLSGDEQYFISNVGIDSFNVLPDGTPFANAVAFRDIRLNDVVGVVAGDLVTITGAVNGSNNVTLREVLDVVQTDQDAYLLLDGAPLVTETPTDAVMSVRSKYNVLPAEAGLGMGGDEVDVAEFERIKTFAFSSIPYYDFYLKDTVDAKKFIDEKILFPSACYTLPRKGRVSLGFTSPPLAVSKLTKLDSENITNPNKIKVKRSTNKYFYNTVIYSYNIDALEDKPLSGYIRVDEDSRNRIKSGTKSLKIEAEGLRPDPANDAIIEINSRRILDRYKFAAEEVTSKAFYGDTFNVEVGDTVLYGEPQLLISNTKTGDRNYQPRLMEVFSKSMNIKTGEVELQLLDTNYGLEGRYGIFSPSSRIGLGSTTSRIKIKPSYGAPSGTLEYDKWSAFIGNRVRIHDEDWTFDEERKFIGFAPDDNYTILLSAPLSMAPPEDYLVDIVSYPDNTDQNDQASYKNVFCFANPSIPVVTGLSQTQFTVSAPDALKFVVGHVIRVHNDDFSVYSLEIDVNDVTGTTVTLSTALGFTPAAGYRCELVGHKDKGAAYRYI